MLHLLSFGKGRFRSVWESLTGNLTLLFPYSNSRNFSNARLDRSVIQTALDRFSGHVLVIMACCHAPAAAAVAQNSSHEYLLGGYAESGVPKASITTRLAKLLMANEGKDITVSQLHAKRLANTEFLENCSPMHVAPRNRSITLRPRKGRNHSSEEEVMESMGEVQISVRLHGEKAVPDPESWKAWLASNIPDDIASINVQASVCRPWGSSDPDPWKPWKPWDMGLEAANSVSSQNDPWAHSLPSRREVEATPSTTVASEWDTPDGDVAW